MCPTDPIWSHVNSENLAFWRAFRLESKSVIVYVTRFTQVANCNYDLILDKEITLQFIVGFIYDELKREIRANSMEFFLEIILSSRFGV